MKVSELLESRQANWRSWSRFASHWKVARGGGCRREGRPVLGAVSGGLCRLGTGRRLSAAGRDGTLSAPTGRPATTSSIAAARSTCRPGPTNCLSTCPSGCSTTTPCGWRFAFSGVCSFCRARCPTPGPICRGCHGKELMTRIEEMYVRPKGAIETRTALWSAFTFSTTPALVLRCFALGLLFGIGGLFATVYNAAFLGGVFGYMATLRSRTTSSTLSPPTAPTSSRPSCSRRRPECDWASR